MSEWINRLLSRKIISPKNEEIRIWQVSDTIPYEVGDLVCCSVCLLRQCFSFGNPFHQFH
jgi:hypothetical protein